MNTGTVMRADVEGSGIRLRIWVDDERGRHLTVLEMRLGLQTIIAWGNEILAREQDAQQQTLPYE